MSPCFLTLLPRQLAAAPARPRGSASCGLPCPVLSVAVGLLATPLGVSDFSFEKCLPLQSQVHPWTVSSSKKLVFLRIRFPGINHTPAGLGLN